MINKKQAYVVATFLVLLVGSMPIIALGQSSTDADTKSQTRKYWDELMHYAMIGRWDLAISNGQALLDSAPDPVQLLDLAENKQYADHYRNLSLLEQDTPLREVATEIMKLVEKGRFMRRTDTQRIADEIKRLSGTTRARMIAIERLKDSGEWAVPVMIEALRDPDRADEMAEIRRVLPQLGKSAINPLVVVIQKCVNLNLKIIVLEALGKIGYAHALPYMQETVESDQSLPELKNAALKAIRAIRQEQVPTQTPAAQLFEKLALDYYDHLSSLEVPAIQELANIWFWDAQKGLYAEQIKRDAFDELMAMRSCESAVRLDPTRSNSVALWLSSFFRLEADGHDQPNYFGPNHADADTYALTAGPEYLHRVLARALANRNRPVALSAIQALARNAGQQSLLLELQARRPLIDALNFPDRQVRFSAALAIGGAAPDKKFQKQDLVVTILAEALRQKGQRNAVVTQADQDKRNSIVSQLRQSNEFSAVASDKFFSVVLKQAKRLASLDLIVLGYDINHPDITAALELMSKDYRLAFCPTLIIAHPDNIIKARKLAQEYSFVEAVLQQTPADEMLKIAQRILADNQAQIFPSALADLYAGQSAHVLWQLALTQNKVLPLSIAESALIEALADDRQLIKRSAIETLARMDSTSAQRALAKLAIDDNSDMEIRRMAFGNLAISAKKFGNLLLAEQIDTIYTNIVSSKDADPQLRNQASQAFGSLNLPSARISQLILDQAKR